MMNLKKVFFAVVLLASGQMNAVPEVSQGIAQLYKRNPWALLEDSLIIRPRIEKDRFFHHLKIIAAGCAGAAAGGGLAYGAQKLLPAGYSASKTWGFVRFLVCVIGSVLGGGAAAAGTVEYLEWSIDAAAYREFIDLYPVYSVVLPEDTLPILAEAFETSQRLGPSALDARSSRDLHHLRHVIYNHFQAVDGRYNDLLADKRPAWKKYLAVNVDIAGILSALVEGWKASQK